MENKKEDWIGYSFTNKEQLLKERKPYKGELEKSKYDLQNKINNLIKDYEDRYKVTVFLERDNEQPFYVWLFIDLDSTIYYEK